MPKSGAMVDHATPGTVDDLKVTLSGKTAYRASRLIPLPLDDAPGPSPGCPGSSP
jgi:hypothetical protein